MFLLFICMTDRKHSTTDIHFVLQLYLDLRTGCLCRNLNTVFCVLHPACFRCERASQLLVSPTIGYAELQWRAFSSCLRCHAFHCTITRVDKVTESMLLHFSKGLPCIFFCASWTLFFSLQIMLAVLARDYDWELDLKEHINSFPIPTPAQAQPMTFHKLAAKRDAGLSLDGSEE